MFPYSFVYVQHYRKSKDSPVTKVHIHCEMAETLVLRKVLKSTNAEHATTIEKDRETTRQQNRASGGPDTPENKVKPTVAHLHPAKVRVC